MPFQERQMDLWSGIADGIAIAITTNGEVKQNGEAIMGKGTALQAKQRYPNIPRLLGYRLTRYGNHCHIFESCQLTNGGITDWSLISFPTKMWWRGKASLELIESSARELMDLIEHNGWTTVYLPRPGTKNGGLDWLEVVTSGALDCLDERVVVVYQ